MPDDDLSALAARVLNRRFRIDGKTWAVAAVMAGPRPWCWLVNVKKPEEQARISVEAVEQMERA